MVQRRRRQHRAEAGIARGDALHVRVGRGVPGTFIGLMSGTSLDGIDAVIARFDQGDTAPACVHSHYQPFQPQLRDALLALNAPGHDELHRAAIAAHQLAHAYAAAIRTLLSSSVSSGARRAECLGSRPAASAAIATRRTSA